MGNGYDPRTLGMGGKYAKTGRQITSGVERAGTVVGNAITKAWRGLGEFGEALWTDPFATKSAKIYRQAMKEADEAEKIIKSVNITNPTLRKGAKKWRE